MHQAFDCRCNVVLPAGTTNSFPSQTGGSQWTGSIAQRRELISRLCLRCYLPDLQCLLQEHPCEPSRGGGGDSPLLHPSCLTAKICHAMMTSSFGGGGWRQQTLWHAILWDYPPVSSLGILPFGNQVLWWPSPARKGKGPSSMDPVPGLPLGWTLRKASHGTGHVRITSIVAIQQVSGKGKKHPRGLPKSLRSRDRISPFPFLLHSSFLLCPVFRRIF